ncbi:FAD-binding oxidoreductase [Flavobacteriaceae bacterium AU392]|nr:FAD-binding oxidoreductase [Flavobacteriaceae bacterium]RKM85114.1 FAD-binding oxidoreductase [Flavobacteriaceae bacterium AU392]
MTISIWRYSHLTLAISSALFLILASVTGIILAFEPISNQLQPYNIEAAKEIRLSQTISILEETYDEILTVEIDNNDFVSASVITTEGENEFFYINPITGEKIGDIIEKKPIFKFATNLHRSLFLKRIGRFFVGLVSFLLFLIAITGVLLIIKRQGNLKRFFSKINKEYFEQYYHIIFGRFLLIPILIIALTGVYLSLEKFSLLPSNKINHDINYNTITDTPKKEVKEFDVFNSIQLKDVRGVEFPFSDDAEDYFYIKLLDKEIIVNQYTGKILSEIEYPFVTLASNWSLIMHTGQGSILWSIILLLASISILFFMYSGFLMTIRRRKKSKNLKNKYKKDECEYIILVGSETGSTFGFANMLYNALLDLNKTVFISELNKYDFYKKAQHLIIFTATYGEGDAPINAKKFKQVFNKIKPNNKLHFSVLGFGSLAYPDFCKYAIEIDDFLNSHSNFKSVLELHKINNQSFESFKNWIKLWNEKTGLPILIKQPEVKKNKNDKPFKVISKTVINEDDTFLLRLKSLNKTKFRSGDLFAFYPEQDNVKRLYSIGKVDGDILLSIKKHQFGICSTYFNKLENNDVIKASIEQNKEFNFPTNAKTVVMIANGTGIAPFLGMLNENNKKVKTHLFWGGRNKTSLELYNDIIETAKKTRRLSTLNIAYSQEKEERVYVQDLIFEEAEFMANVLKNKGVVLICGSVAMQNQVIKVLERITKTQLNLPISEFQNREQIRMDCY